MSNKEPKLHLLAELFPPMTDVEFEALKKDIAENGQEDRVTFWNGMLVDGRHRWRACKELGIECDAFDLECDEGELYEYVLSKNLHRRHLTESQRAMVAAKLATLKRGEVGNGRKVEGPIGPPSIEQAADMLNVGTTTVKRAKQVLEHGSKEIIQAVERGELPVSFTAKVVAEEPDKKIQAQLWKDGGKAALKAHISEASTYADSDDELRVSATKTIARLWKKWNAVERAAVRVWIDEHFLDSED